MSQIEKVKEIVQIFALTLEKLHCIRELHCIEKGDLNFAKERTAWSLAN